MSENQSIIANMRTGEEETRKPEKEETELEEADEEEEGGMQKPKAELLVFGNANASLQANFLRFRTQKVKERKLLQATRDERLAMGPRTAEFKEELRARFIDGAKKYLGVPYAERYKAPDVPVAPLYLDCCGLVRKVLQDLQEDFGFVIGRWNQCYQMDTLPLVIEQSELKPGDLIFYEGIFNSNRSKPQKHNNVHVEIYLGGETGEATIGSRYHKGCVSIFPSFKFKSTTWDLVQYHFRSIDTWLEGVCESCCSEHPWLTDALANSAAAGKRSIFNQASDDEDAGDIGEEEKEEGGGGACTCAQHGDVIEDEAEEADAASSAAAVVVVAETIAAVGTVEEEEEEDAFLSAAMASVVGAAVAAAEEQGAALDAAAAASAEEEDDERHEEDDGEPVPVPPPSPSSAKETLSEAAQGFASSSGSGSGKVGILAPPLLVRGAAAKPSPAGKGRRPLAGTLGASAETIPSPKASAGASVTAAGGFVGGGQAAAMKRDRLARSLNSLETAKAGGPPPPHTYYVCKSNGWKLVKAALDKRGWQQLPFEYQFSSRFSLKWVEGRSQIDYRSHVPGQLVCHIPNNEVLTTKLGLLNALRDCFCRISPTSTKRKPTPWVPETYQLENPSEIAAALEADEKHALENGGQGPIWIYKPSCNNRGRGIKVISGKEALTEICMGKQTRDPETTIAPAKGIIQRYIEKPLLVPRGSEGFKFDYRCYMLIARNHPNTLAFFHTGYCRLTLKPYTDSIESLGDATVHLTNAAVQKKDPLYEANRDFQIQSPEQIARLIEASGNVEGAKFIREQLDEQVKLCMKDLLKASMNKFLRKHGYFDLFGLDFMVTADGKLLLLEVNTNPALSLDNAVLEELLPEVIDGTIDLVLAAQGPDRDASASDEQLLANIPGRFELLLVEEPSTATASSSSTSAGGSKKMA